MKKIFSVILGLIILVTSMGFTVSSHICGGRKVDTKIRLTDADVSCDMEKTDEDYTGTRLNNNCCQDEFNKLQLNENYTQQYTMVNFSPDFTIAFIMVLVKQLPEVSTQQLFFKDYSPPPLVRDIPVLVQSFLI